MNIALCTCYGGPICDACLAASTSVDGRTKNQSVKVTRSLDRGGIERRPSEQGVTAGETAPVVYPSTRDRDVTVTWLRDCDGCDGDCEGHEGLAVDRADYATLAERISAMHREDATTKCNRGWNAALSAVRMVVDRLAERSDDHG